MDHKLLCFNLTNILQISKKVLELQAENAMLKTELLRLEEEEGILRAKLASQ